MKIKGKVVTGLGESGKFLAIEWVHKAVCEKFAFTPFCGTLNIDVQDAAIQRNLLRSGTDKIISCEEGFCDAVTYRGRINGQYDCGVIIPLVPNYPDKILEIVAPLHLKDALGINDGDEIELELDAS